MSYQSSSPDQSASSSGYPALTYMAPQVAGQVSWRTTGDEKARRSLSCALDDGLCRQPVADADPELLEDESRQVACFLIRRRSRSTGKYTQRR